MHPTRVSLLLVTLLLGGCAAPGHQQLGTALSGLEGELQRLEEELASIERYDIISQYRLKHFEVSEPVIDDFLASIKPGEDLDRLIAAGVLSEGVEVATGAALDEIIDERTGKDAE